MLGHPGEETTRKTAAFYGWELTGKFEICDDCATAKAKQASVAKTTETKSDKRGERIFIDSSSVKGESYGRAKFWLLALDDKTDNPTSFFLQRKSETKTKMVPWIKDLKSKHGIVVKFIHCDDAGENVSFEKACLAEGLGIQFEYTAAGTPQFNGRVERTFLTLYGRVRSMMNAAKMPQKMRTGVWTECAATASKNDSLMVTNTKPISSHNQFFEKEPKFARHLRTFGEIGIVTNPSTQKIKAKLADRGKTCMFVGYAENHASGVYRMLNLKTNRILKTRDVIWMKKQYGDYEKIDNKKMATVNNEEEDDDNTVITVSSDDNNSDSDDNNDSKDGRDEDRQDVEVGKDEIGQ